MALIQLNYVSNALQRTVPVQVILPVDKLTPDGKLPARKKFKTLYLLHGYLGNYTDWVSGTRIQRWAEERDLAVVMPSGDNAFYVDHPATGNGYGRFIGEELVEITRRMFPLSDKREDTFIGGLSMGGYGALRNGLKYHETFGAVISLSGVVEIVNMPKVNEDKAYFEAVFGPQEQAILSDNNPHVLVKRLEEMKKKDSAAKLPKIYLCCGMEDRLLEQSRICHKVLLDAGFDVTYEEGPGDHNWDFWDTYIKKIIDWLPLDPENRGRNSGNVH